MTRGARVGLYLLWLALIVAVGWGVARHLKISSDLRDFVPPARTADQQLLLDEIGKGPGSRLLLLAISGAPPARLSELSQGLDAALVHDPDFAHVANGSGDLAELAADLLPYRYLLSPTLDTQRFDAAYLHAQLQQRVEDLSSPAASMLEPWLRRDPTLETLKLAQLWAPPHQPKLVDGVWFSDQGEALLVAETKAAGFDPGAQAAAIASLQEHFAALPGATSTRLVVSGPGWFGVQASRDTRAEADRFGAITTVGFVLMLLLAYRSAVPVLVTALPLLSGAVVGFALLALIFGHAHGITVAFGFTLLGVAQEYPLRVFSHRRVGVATLQCVRELWPLLATAIVSVCIAYLAFFASGVAGLQQLAVFTIGGLVVAGICTRWLLPLIVPAAKRDMAATPGLATAWHFLARLPRPRWLPWLVAVAGVCVVVFAPGAFWQNDLSALTPIPQAELQRDARLRAALGAPDVRYLLVLRAPTSEAVLDLSERAAPQMHALIVQHALDGFELPSRYLPSIATQKARQAKLPDAADLQSALQQAMQGLPFRAGVFAPFVADVEAARKLPPLTPEKFEQSPLGARLASMLVQQGDGWVGLGTLSGVNDPAAFATLTQSTGGAVHLLDLKASTEALIIAYRHRILVALGIAALLLCAAVTLALRSPRRALHVLGPMTLATLLVLVVLRAAGIPLSLFHLVSLTLAAGLGLHYALFFERRTGDGREDLRTLHATLVCVASALLVFGVLALSSVPVLRAIGLTVALGVAFHFTLSVLMAPHQLNPSPSGQSRRPWPKTPWWRVAPGEGSGSSERSEFAVPSPQPLSRGERG
ncbi:MAG: putative membrane exporter protein [Rhodanobacteraceae bacterium]|jgi:predicted exporter|nr:MAG: putative membrane exporter protein [Rhodanobacteraceae bacterium]